MKNALLYFYNIEISNDDIKKINNNYYFNYQNSNFVVYNYERNIDEAKELYLLHLDMINNGVPIYKIVLTNNNDCLFYLENKYYILMIMPKIKNRIITYDDVLKFNYIPSKTYKLLDKSSWPIYWSNKIDYIEYQFNQFQNKYPIIKKSINYYIGIWENAISYYNNIEYDNSIKCICHKRLTTKTDLLSFFNPIEFVIDYKERDLGDYIKSYVYDEKYTKEILNNFLTKIPLNKNIIIRFISRIMFPSKYFDLYENIIYNGTDEESINTILNDRETFSFLLRDAFNYYKKTNIPIIEWIIKED